MVKLISIVSIILFSLNSNYDISYFEDGRASDCVRQARNATFEIAAEWNDHPNDDPFYMELYMELYTSCLD